MAMLSMIGFDHARSVVMDHTPILKSQLVKLDFLTSRVLAEDVTAEVDLPGCDVSLKDGYAVCSKDLVSASVDKPVELKVVGKCTAGGSGTFHVRSGSAVRITTGATIPEGSDSVLAEEFCRVSPDGDDRIVCFADAHPGRNILRRGSDITRGEIILEKGTRLTPADVGLIAAAGIDSVEVLRRPRVMVLATGDEVVLPGKRLAEGKLFASNLVEIGSWLSSMGVNSTTKVVADDASLIKKAIEDALKSSDVIITTGGAWTSEKDLIVGVFDELGWDARFHRVRMGPGKGVGFGLLQGRAVFCLPGGPPSSEMALLQLALPAVLHMQAIDEPLFPVIRCVLLETVKGQADWTQFVPAKLEQLPMDAKSDRKNGILFGVRPYRIKSRLQSMARKQALIKIPEGKDGIFEGEPVDVQLVRSTCFMATPSYGARD